MSNTYTHTHTPHHHPESVQRELLQRGANRHTDRLWLETTACAVTSMVEEGPRETRDRLRVSVGR